jgi:hypothetical protein
MKCSTDIKYEHSARTSSMDIKHGHAAQTCSTDMQHGHAVWTYSMDMKQGHTEFRKHVQHGHAWTCRIDLNEMLHG